MGRPDVTRDAGERLSPMLTQYVDRMYDASVGTADVIPHESRIKARWRADPYAWARERLGLRLVAWSMYNKAKYVHHQWDGTREPLLLAARELAAGHSVAIASCTGGGKTYLGAVLLLWFLDCWEGSRVVTVAPRKDQLAANIWKEVARLWPLFEKLHPKTALMGSMEIRMKPWIPKDEWGALATTCGVGADEEVANKIRGYHAEHFLWVVEETTGVHPAILAAIKMTCTAPHNLRLFFGNPDSDQDSLALVSQEPGVTPIRLSGLDHPNVVLDDPSLMPGAISRSVLKNWELELGSDDPIYNSRARGIAPGQHKNALIRVEWIDAAIARSTSEEWADWRREQSQKPNALGLDVAASETGDLGAYAFGPGGWCRELKSARCPDAGEFARRFVWPLIESGLLSDRLTAVDGVGVGHAAWSALKALGATRTIALIGGQWDHMIDRQGEQAFASLRCQMWWQARVDLQKGEVALPESLTLRQDLTAPRWGTRAGKIVVESKADFSKRLGRSPDEGDAFVYWNWIRHAQRYVDLSAGDDTSGIAF